MGEHIFQLVEKGKVLKSATVSIRDFIPIVEIDKKQLGQSNKDKTWEYKGFEIQKVFNENKQQLKTELYPSLDDLKVEQELYCIKFDGSSNEIVVKFNIKQGSRKSKDTDGIIIIKSNGVNLKTKDKIKTQYGHSIALRLSSQDLKNDAYIDFYASDDGGYFDEKGKQNVFCGRVKIVFDYCVCSDWATVPPIIPSSKFIGWGHPGVTRNCYHYSLEQLKQVGHWVKTERWNKKWDGTKELNDHIYQLFLEADVAGMTKGVQKEQFKKGIEYLKKSIKSKIPVMVGVDDDNRLSNDDLTTEHFVVIVGMGTDTVGNYFLFYDNAVPDSFVGTHSDNKLYCKCKDFKLEGEGSLLNAYIQRNTSKKKYTVTQIRETK